jgi:CBS domain-containing protein
MKDELKSILDAKGHRVFGVSPDTSVEEAVRLMVEQRIGSVLVMNGQTPIGIFTERDVMCRVLDPRLDPVETKISQVMTRNPITVSPRTTVEEAMVLMTGRRLRRLPVVENGRVLGMISIGDLTKWVVRDNEQLLSYIVGSYPG